LRLSEPTGVTLGEHGLIPAVVVVVVVVVLFFEELGGLPRILPENKGGFLSSLRIAAVLAAFTVLFIATELLS